VDGPAGEGQDSPGSCDDEQRKGASSLSLSASLTSSALTQTWGHYLVQREERGCGGPIEIELGQDCRVRVGGGFETRDLERMLGVRAERDWC